MNAVYFAGPDIFRLNYPEFVEYVKKLCLKKELKPLLPGDTELRNSKDIFQHNLELIRQSGAVIANLNPFRSPVEPDSGTAFECAFAFSLNKAVFGILEDQRDLKSKLIGSGVRLDHNGLCPGQWLVENFGLPLNLMLAHSLEAVCRSLEEALEKAAEYFNHQMLGL